MEQSTPLDDSSCTMADISAPQIKIQSPGHHIQTMSSSPPKDGVIIARDGDARASISDGKGSYVPSTVPCIMR